MAITYRGKWPELARQWDAMRLDSSRVAEFEKAAKYAIKYKSIYQQIERSTQSMDASGRMVLLTGVPWPMVACNHWRESGGDFDAYLGNGQPLNRRTTIVPIGRGPFTGRDAFVSGAIDAYELQKFNEIIDWRLEKILYRMLLFNGTGYEPKPSPYIWGGTNIQVRGKFVADHVFDPNVMDTQLGCAGILYMIAKLDPTVEYPRETVEGAVEPPPAPVIIPPAAPPIVTPPTVPPTSAGSELQAMVDRRKQIVDEIAKLQAEDAETAIAIEAVQKWLHRK